MEMLTEQEHHATQARSGRARVLDVLACLLLAAVVLGIYFPVLNADWSAKDDWTVTLIGREHPPHPQMAKWAEVYDHFGNYGLRNDLHTWGRFRPVYWALVTVEAHVFHNHPRLWHLDTILIGIATVLVFYGSLRMLGMGALAATMCGLWMILSAGELWTELQIAEKPAMLLVMLAVLGFVRGARVGRLCAWDWLALLCAAMAGGMKESFTLLLPAMVLLRVVLQVGWFHETRWPDALRNLRWLIIAAALVCVAQLGMAAYALTQGIYSKQVVEGAGGAETGSRLSPLAWARLIWPKPVAMPLAYYIPIAGLGALVPSIARDAVTRRRAWMLAGVIVLWLLPQLMLYGKVAVGFHNYYRFPAIVALIALCGIGLEMLRGKWLRRIVVPALVVVSLVFLLCVTPDRIEYNLKWATNTRAIGQAVRVTAAGAEDGELLLVGDTWWGLGASYLVHLGEQGVRSPAYLQLTDERTDPNGQLQRRLLGEIFKPEDEASPDRITVITAFMPMDRFVQVAPAWFLKEEWQAEPVVVQWPSVKYMNRSLSTVEYTVLTRISTPSPRPGERAGERGLR